MSWKLLVGVLLILVVLSSTLAGNLGGLKDTLFSGFEKVVTNLKDTPLSGVFPNVKTSKVLDVVITADVLEIKPDGPISLNSETVKAEDFNGDIKIDFETGEVIYRERGSSFNFNTKLEGHINNLKFKKVILDRLGIKILNDDWDITTENGTIEIYDFSGKGVIKPDSFELIGNVSDVIRK